MTINQKVSGILEHSYSDMHTEDIHDIAGNILMKINCSNNIIGAILICKHNMNHYNVNELCRSIQIHIVTHFVKYGTNDITLLHSAINDMNVILEEIDNYIQCDKSNVQAQRPCMDGHNIKYFTTPRSWTRRKRVKSQK